MVVRRRFSLSSVIERMVASLTAKCIRHRLPSSRVSGPVPVPGVFGDLTSEAPPAGLFMSQGGIRSRMDDARQVPPLGGRLGDNKEQSDRGVSRKMPLPREDVDATTPKFLRDKYAIVGVGETAYTRGSEKTTRALATIAVRNAMH